MLNEGEITTNITEQNINFTAHCYLTRSAVSHAGHTVSMIADEKINSFAGYMLMPQGKNIINMRGTLTGGGIYVGRRTPYSYLYQCRC